MLGQTLVPVDDPALMSGLFSDTNPEYKEGSKGLHACEQAGIANHTEFTWLM